MHRTDTPAVVVATQNTFKSTPQRLLARNVWVLLVEANVAGDDDVSWGGFNETSFDGDS